MLKSKHRQIIADAEDMAALRLENNNGLRKQLADEKAKARELQDIIDHLSEQSDARLIEIIEMQDIYNLGRKRRANMDADNARKRAARARKADPYNLPY